MPRASIIVSSFNREHLIVDCIESIKDQTLSDLEAIIADDGSNEATREAILRTIGNDPRFKVLWNAGGSPTMQERLTGPFRYAICINVALRVATGDYVSYTPDDDYLEPTGTEARVRALDENPDIHVVYGKQRSINYDGSSWWDTRGRPRPGRTFPKEGEIDPATGCEVQIASWYPGLRPLAGLDHGQIMHRRICLSELGSGPSWPEIRPCDPIGVGDAAFFARFDAIGHKALAVDNVCTVKRYHKSNYSEPTDVRE